MAIHDVIGDFLTRIRNASKARLDSVEIKSSKLLQSLAELLRDEGYISSVKAIKDQSQLILKITLKYDAGHKSVFRIMRRVSKPSRRVYVDADEIKPLLGGIGTRIISTSQGLLTDRQARRAHVGGEILCEVW
ncbi:TPA: 30S ribosomal protein S8 [bacterium]|nr:30S ribosomal protein S8 [bacterium]